MVGEARRGVSALDGFQVPSVFKRFAWEAFDGAPTGTSIARD